MDDMMQFFGAFDGHSRASVAVKQAEVEVFDGFLFWISRELTINERSLVLIKLRLSWIEISFIKIFGVGKQSNSLLYCLQQRQRKSILPR